MPTTFPSPPAIHQASCLDLRVRVGGEGPQVSWTMAYEDVDGNAMGAVRMLWYRDPRLEAKANELLKLVEQVFVERSSGVAPDVTDIADNADGHGDEGIAFRDP
jgi:hypothetical protein